MHDGIGIFVDVAHMPGYGLVIKLDVKHGSSIGCCPGVLAAAGIVQAGPRWYQVGSTIANPSPPLAVRKIHDLNEKGPEHLGNVYTGYRRVAGDALVNNCSGKKRGRLAGPACIR
jgi:hypothetical protein